MGHDAETGLQNGCHYSDISAVPEQPAVVQLIMLTEPVILNDWGGGRGGGGGGGDRGGPF